MCLKTECLLAAKAQLQSKAHLLVWISLSETAQLRCCSASFAWQCSCEVQVVQQLKASVLCLSIRRQEADTLCARQRLLEGLFESKFGLVPSSAVLDLVAGSRAQDSADSEPAVLHTTQLDMELVKQAKLIMDKR